MTKEQALTGRVALVTGASRGIGRAVAIELARHGAHVTVNYRVDVQSAQQTAAAITALGGEAHVVQADVSKAQDVKALVRATVREFGQLDILVCNAGVVRGELTAIQSLDSWQSIIDTNLTGCFLCIRESVPQMMFKRRGAIVCMSSRLATRGTGGLAAYGAAKGGVDALVRCVAVELAKKKIRVNAVAPGLISTDMTKDLDQVMERKVLDAIPLQRYGEAEEVARVVRFLVSDDASYITGEVVGVNGGLGV